MQSACIICLSCGPALKNLKKKVFRNGKQLTKNCKMCSLCGSSARYHGNACRIKEVLVLVFESRDMWQFLRTVFSPKFQNLSISNRAFHWKTFDIFLMCAQKI